MKIVWEAQKIKRIDFCCEEMGNALFQWNFIEIKKDYTAAWVLFKDSEIKCCPYCGTKIEKMKEAKEVK